MPVVVERGWLFTFDEIKILLYGIGAREVEGIYMGENLLTEQEIIPALHQMADRGMISAEENGFVMRQDVRKMVEIMAHPSGTFVWKVQDMGGPEFFCYAAPGEVVVSERYWRKKDTLKLRLFSTEAFEAWKEQIEDDYSGY